MDLMRTRWNVDVRHGEKRPYVEYLPDTEEDVKALEEMWAKGELAMPRDEKDYLHVKEKTGKWIWLGPREKVNAGFADLTATLNTIRPGVQELVPGIYLLPRFYSEVIGKDGVEELADQARLLLGDGALMGVLSDAARFLVTTLAVLDIPEAMTDEDKTAPGQGMEEEK